MSIEYRLLNTNVTNIDTIDELIKLDNYNNIIWLKIKNITFYTPFFFPTNLQLIYINDCKNIKYLERLPKSITFIEIINCTMTNVNNLFSKDMNYVETINLSKNRIVEIPKNLPESLISLDLSENDIDILPLNICFPKNIKNINLSYNKLQDLPEWFLELNAETYVSLMPNKFWFNLYTNISLNKTIQDYHIQIANRFFDISLGRKLVNTRNINRINLNNRRTTFEQGQNVHNSDIQDSFSKSIANIMKNTSPRIPKYLDKIWWYYIFDGFNIAYNLSFIYHIRINCNDPTVVSRNGVTYGELLERIWAISEIHEHKIEMRKVLRQEITSGIDVCFTGRVTRLVNSLTGFIEEVQVGISENEQISNVVITLMKKYENDPDIDIRAKVKEALDELKISEEKQKDWLNAL